MPEIHKALGWKAPPTTFAPDHFEALALYSALADFDRGDMLAQLRTRHAAAQSAAQAAKKSGSRRNT
jgi:hypothetical protein